MLAEIEARLATLPELRQVEGAAAFSRIKSAPPPHLQPAAWVIPIAERAQPSDLIGAVNQRVEVRIGVALALGGFRDTTGAGAAKEMEAIERAVQLRLIGWPPTADHDEINYAGGSTVMIKDGVVWRQLEFTTAHYLRLT